MKGLNCYILNQPTTKFHERPSEYFTGVNKSLKRLKRMKRNNEKRHKL